VVQPLEDGDWQLGVHPGSVVVEALGKPAGLAFAHFSWVERLGPE
jgi:hypothetical protein